jgi:hypothetical protein
MKHFRVLVLLLRHVVLTTLLVVSVGGRQGCECGEPTNNSLVPLQGCLVDREVSSAVQTLAYGSYDEQQQAVAHLRTNANRSDACRKQVITKLLSAMDQPNLDTTGGQPQFYVWHYGARLLGEMKAVEALDFLVANFDLNDGTPFPFNHHPAIGAVVDMDEIALPKLQTVLMNNPDRYTRRYVVFCIALIGGKAASGILKEAQVKESDPCVASCIRASLAAFGNKRRPDHISADSRTNWYTTFLCSGE